MGINSAAKLKRRKLTLSTLKRSSSVGTKHGILSLVLKVIIPADLAWITVFGGQVNHMVLFSSVVHQIFLDSQHVLTYVFKVC